MTRTTTDISSRNDIMLAEPPLSPHNDDDTAAALDSKSSADERPLWSHRWTFFTTLLSVQLSQLWRPAVWIGANATTYSFALLAMACTSIALLSIGLPLLILELALGQAYREGAVGVWQVPYFVGQFHSRWTAFGLVSLLVAFVTASYGVVILAWLMHAFVDSFRHTTSASVVWSGEEEQVYISAVEYFFSQIIGQATLMIHNRNDEEDNSNTIQQPTRLVVDNVVYAALIWFLVWAGSSLGVSKLGNLSTFLVIVATILLSTLLGASVSVLTVSSDSPSSSLSRGESVIPPDSAGMMLEAVVQTIYGVGLATGILSTYASYSPNKKDHVAQLASVYTILNAFFVLITGYAISVALDGSGMFNNGNDKDTMANGLHPGPLRAIFTSVFIQWPLALNRLGDGSMGWVRLVFVTFFCLGIQFMWAVQTAILTVLRDANTVSTPRYVKKSWSLIRTCLCLCFTTRL